MKKSTVAATRFPVRMMALCALFASLTAVCAQITVPIDPVPISLSLLPVLLCAALLDARYSTLTALVYLLMGMIGLPVFSGLSGGFGKLVGPTGGYIIGYIPCALLTSLGIARFGRKWYVQALSMAVGVLACYLLGTVWFMVSTHRTLAESLALCVFPFLPGDALKIAAAMLLSLRLEPILRKTAGR